jgi:hypothetical protein
MIWKRLLLERMGALEDCIEMQDQLLRRWPHWNASFLLALVYKSKPRQLTHSSEFEPRHISSAP